MRQLLAAGLIASLLAGSALGAETSPLKLKSRTITPSPSLEALDAAAARQAEHEHFFVQLAEPFRPDAIDEIRDLGVELSRYLPENTWIADFPLSAMTDPAVRDRFVWAGDILPRDKMPRRMWSGTPGEWAFQDDGRLEMRVRLHDDESPAPFEEKIRSLGAEVTAPMSIFPGFTILGDPSMVYALAEMDETMWITEGLPPIVPDNDGNREITNVEVVQQPPYGLSGLGVNVGIWDAGAVDANHDDFSGRLFFGEQPGVSSHATHVAGTIGGSGFLSESNGGGPLEWRGMAPQCEIYSYDFYGDLIGEMTSAIQSFDMDMCNNSWSYGVGAGNCEDYGDYDSPSPEFDALVRGAGGKRISMFFSAGNERNDGDCPLIEDGYGCIPRPKASKNMVVVGASNSDEDDMTDFSSWGPVDDGRIRPDIVAPGCEEFGEGYVKSTLPGDGYGGPGYCGTSMSTPTMTGIGALLYELYAAENGGADPEPSLIKGLLVTTAVDKGNPGPDYAWGHGRVDALAAADALLYDSQIVSDAAHDDVIEIEFTVPLHQPPDLRLSLVWDDPDAAPLSDPALVNNLDLVLIDPNNLPLFPWVLDPESPSQNAARGIDNLNNVEHVTVAGPTPGEWIARIKGTNVPVGPQTFSLVGLDLKRPSQPTNLEASNVTTTSVDLTWENAPEKDRKRTLIARSRGAGGWVGPSQGQTFVEGQFIVPGVIAVYVRDQDHSSEPFTDSGLEPGGTYGYRVFEYDDFHNYSIPSIVVVTTDGPSDVEPAGGHLPLALHHARPNPAEGSTEISFSLPGTRQIGLRLFDPSGRLVRTLVNGVLEGGTYRYRWDGRDAAGRPAAAGVYFYQLHTQNEKISRQLMWLR